MLTTIIGTIVVIVILLIVAAKVFAIKWLEHKNLDSDGNNYAQYVFLDDKISEEDKIRRLRGICAYNPDCLGFNSQGYFKNKILPTDKLVTKDGHVLYVKQL